jgi:GH35 family endo-1,4-beta-xylanase
VRVLFLLCLFVSNNNNITCFFFFFFLDCPVWGSDQEVLQGEIYANLLTICLEESTCTSFETWGFTDKYTWLTDFYGGTNEHPLPFDEEYSKKPAYNDMLEVLTSTMV